MTGKTTKIVPECLESSLLQGKIKQIEKYESEHCLSFETTLKQLVAKLASKRSFSGGSAKQLLSSVGAPVKHNPRLSRHDSVIQHPKLPVGNS